MASFDSASKRLVQQNPRDFVAFCFNLRNMTGVEFSDVELITPEQPTVEMRQADVLIQEQDLQDLQDEAGFAR